MKIFALSGSLRKASFNTALLRAVAELAPEGCTVDVVTPAGVPLYDGDLETESGIPEQVTALKQQLHAADGLILATPEYNGGMPGVLKNTIDWMSRPMSESPFKDKPVALLGASPGRMGTVFAQTTWLPVFRTLGMKPWFGKNLYVGGASKLFEDGKLTDQATRERVSAFVSGFVEAIS